ncbi:MAG: hypothetical protein AAF291_13660 [Pseudomonadota bacterium]
MAAFSRNANSWQLILADLALILFLSSAAALSAGAEEEDAPHVSAASPSPIAPSQALYRPGPGLPSLGEWLAQQPRDPRAALTIVAQHQPGQEEQAWSDARSMAATARSMGVRARVIIREGEVRAIHASLGYDQPLR